MAVNFVGLLGSALFTAALILTPAAAQEKAKDAKSEAAAKSKGGAKRTVLLENSKVTAFEVSQMPGDENKAVPSASSRVVRALKGGTLMRTYADGKTEKVEWKAGQVRFLEPDKGAYTTKNIGKSEVHLYVVVLK